MNREQFKLLAAGQYAMMNIEGTIEKDKLLVFLEGATFAWDILVKEYAEKMRLQNASDSASLDL